jgi:fused signal recognition particle receptor
MGLFGLFKKDKKQGLVKGLERSREGLYSKLARLISGKSRVDDEVLEELEEILISSDVGVDTTIKIIQKIEKRVASEKGITTDQLDSILREEIIELLDRGTPPMEELSGDDPYVIMVVGVNGVGKTTTIGKLATQLKAAGKTVVLGAADTFRAAAVDQLKIWSERAGVELVQQGMGADPASVAFDTLQSAKAKNADVVIIDTAGRLHNKVNLMNELTKVKNVMRKIVPSAPHEVLLVLDASTGQNAMVQAKQFSTATDVNALALTKVDGTAKGGVAIGICDQLEIPIKYLGVGEGKDDLQPFDAVAFVESLFQKNPDQAER